MRPTTTTAEYLPIANAPLQRRTLRSGRIPGLFLLVACLLGSNQVESFSSLLPNGRSIARSTGPSSTSTTSSLSFKMPTTVDPAGTMTTEDEAVLFGEIEGEESVDPSLHRRHVDKFGNRLPYAASVGGVTDHLKHDQLDHARNNPLANKLHTVRDVLEACPHLWRDVAREAPDHRALLDEHLCDTRVELTFAETADQVAKSAAAFSGLGVTKGTNVAILGENSAHWLLVDHGIQLAGGASAVRGADAPLDELRYVYDHSDSCAIAVLQGPKLLQKLGSDAKSKNLMAPLGLSNAKHGPVQTVVLMHREKKSNEEIAAMGIEFGVRVLVFADLLDASTTPFDDSSRGRLPTLTRDDLATIVYTSGTTGNPKGVMLTHGNLIHQTGHRLAPTRPFEESEPLPGDANLSLLPVWHITERTFELWMASRGCSVIYSTIRTFKADLAKHKPQWLVLVPRVLEKVATGVQDKFASGSVVVKALSKFFTAVGSRVARHRKIVNGLVVADEPPDPVQKLVSRIALAVLAPLNAVGNKLVWSKVQDGFGGNVKAIISGGSALAGSLEQFYETAGLTVCVGYGLTECSPIISYRRSDANLVAAGCAGKPCAETQLRIVDPEAKPPPDRPRPGLATGQVGVVLAKGPQVMRGYYKNPKATAAAVDEWGWFDTGDLGRINPATGDLILTGRAKDTIVLSNGENIEPIPIEDAIMSESDLVEQVMLTGQDGRRLVAIAVLSPNELANAGFLEKDEAVKLQAANEKANDPKCEAEECRDEFDLLNAAAARLRSNPALKAALLADATKAITAGGFRQWEKVADVYLTLEPFAMANGQLTQSYKVKRNVVSDRYEGVLPS